MNCRVTLLLSGMTLLARSAAAYSEGQLARALVGVEASQPSSNSFQNLKSVLPPWSPGNFSIPSEPGEKSIEKLPAVLVRADRLPIVTSVKPDYGLFNIPPGVTLAEGTIGNLKLSVGVWRHVTVGPSYGPPIYVVDLFHLTW